MKTNQPFKGVNSLLLLFIFFTTFTAFAQPANDNPCGATVLVPGATCVYTPTTTVGATATTGVPAPGCAGSTYLDVWYQTIVPASGSLMFDTNTGTITDGGMAIYSGTCSSLTLIGCNDNGSSNGLMPKLSVSGQTPGSTVWIRFWKYGSGTGTFSICAKSLPAMPACGSSPVAGNSCATATPICNLNGYCGNTSASYTANSWNSSCGFLGLSNCGLTGVFCGSIENNSFLSFTASATSISFDVWVNSSTLGYGIQILIFKAAGGCSGNVTQFGPCYNPGVVEPGPVNITATGLTIGSSYYIMIDGNSGDVCNYTIGANSGISIPVSVSPTTASVCPGQTVNLTAVGGNGTYNWNATSQLNTTSGANVIATPPSTPGIYTYTANSATGNPLCPSATSAIATITVNPCGCTVTAGNSGPVCSGSAFNLTATNVLGATYAWSGPSGYSSTSQNPTGVIAPLAAGTYDYTVTATVAGLPCTSTTTITVIALPTVNAGTYAPLCSGSSAIGLTGTPAGGSFSGTGVTGSSFNPASGTQTISYLYTDANSCSNTANTTITVNPQPTFTVVLTSNPTICGGSDGSITFNGLTASTAYNLSYSDDGISIGPIAITSTVGGSYVLTGLNSGTYNNFSITLGACFYISPTSITLTDPSAPVFTATLGSNPTTCLGTNGTIFISGLTASTMYSFTYSDDGTSVGPASITTDASGNYTLTGLNAGSYSNFTMNFAGCIGAFAGPIVLTDPTTPNLVITNPASVCSPSIVDITAAGVIAGSTNTGAMSYWNDMAATSTLSNPSTISVSGTYYIQTTSAGCTDIKAVSVVVSQTPNIVLTSPSAVCSPNTVDLTNPAVTLGSTNVTTFSYWSNAGATTTLSNAATIGTSGTYYIQATNSGCTSITPVTVAINPLPTVSAGTYGPICVDGANIPLAGTPAGGNFTGTGVSANNFAPTAGTSTVTYSYTDGNGCSNTSNTTITVNPLPIVNAGQDITICADGMITLSGSGAQTYSWSNSVVNNTQFNGTIGSTTYTLTGTDANGCISTDVVTVNVLPIPVSSVSPDVTTGTIGTTVNFDNYSLNSTSFTWNFGDGATGVTTNLDAQSNTYNVPGTYYMTLTATNGVCTVADMVTIVIEPFAPPVINIPNVFTPNNDGSNDLFFIETQNVASIDYIIVNRWGNNMFETNETDKIWNGLTKHDIESEEGVYFIKYNAIGINGEELKGHGSVTLVR